MILESLSSGIMKQLWFCHLAVVMEELFAPWLYQDIVIVA